MQSKKDIESKTLVWAMGDRAQFECDAAIEALNLYHRVEVARLQAENERFVGRSQQMQSHIELLGNELGKFNRYPGESAGKSHKPLTPKKHYRKTKMVLYLHGGHARGHAFHEII